METTAGVRKRFIGVASHGAVRWAIARRYRWLELASAAAYATTGGAYCNSGTLVVSPSSSFQFDPATGVFADWQLTQFMQQFLTNIRVPKDGPANISPDPEDWIKLNDATFEHAKWLTGERAERLLGSDLTTSSVVLLPNQTVDELRDVVLKQAGRFVAVVDSERTFRFLVDRSTTLESLAKNFLAREGQ